MKNLSILIMIVLLASCYRHQSKSMTSLPGCLEEKIAELKKLNETPVYVRRYEYNDRLVYYMKSACCDKFNVVYDSDCNVLGHPDGGFTGRGDGSLTDFRNNAKNGVDVWRIKEP